MATAFSYKGTDSAGAVVTQYNYSPFGETQVIGTDPIGLSQPFRFSGRELDAETGAHDAHRLSTLQPDLGPVTQREASGGHAPRARYYSPEMRRFISEDPIRKSIGLLATLGAGDVNFYAYVSNNPVNITDPLGLDPAYLGDLGASEKTLTCVKKCLSKNYSTEYGNLYDLAENLSITDDALTVGGGHWISNFY